MKLLFDENLSRYLVDLLSDLYPGSMHVEGAGLDGAEDSAVWSYAKDHRFAIVSKDSDFTRRSILERDSPKIIWLRLGNCSTAEVEKALRAAHPAVKTFIQVKRETCLLLNRR